MNISWEQMDTKRRKVKYNELDHKFTKFSLHHSAVLNGGMSINETGY